ncbi:MAG: ABC transporter ATP-binding protein [Planctomycetota bacterium]|nr:MAG: ABC transporter ATP-binding protein [Planctomycetota bacterium]
MPQEDTVDEHLLIMRGVSKGFVQGGRRIEVLADLNLTIHTGELVAIVGSSGSGKSTLVSLIAGLQTPDSGTIEFAAKPVSGPGPERGVVFQNYSLLPWLSVTDNIALAVNSVFPQWSTAERQEYVHKFIQMVNLSHAAHKRPSELSGGMRQRVSLARTLAIKPRLLLLDEPLSALDALTRAVLQQEIARICADEKITGLLITNDIDEALLLADRVIPLTAGPKATLGPSFVVDLPRPRDASVLFHTPEFRELRTKVMTHLLEMRHSTHASAKPARPLPSVIPVHERWRPVPKEAVSDQPSDVKFFAPKG